MISAGISEHKEAEKDNLLYSEVVQHTLFCKRKLQVVYGRKSTVGVKRINDPTVEAHQLKLG